MHYQHNRTILLIIIINILPLLLHSLPSDHTLSGIYMKWDSFVPKSYKKGLVNCLVFRAWKLCSSYVLFHSEILFVKELLMSNGYPTNFIDSIVHRFLSKQFSNMSCSLMVPTREEYTYACHM